MVHIKTFLSLLAVFLAYYYYYYYYTQTEIVKPESPIVKTLLGSLRGVTSKSRDGREFYEYLGIPYAKPPTGTLRFESPQPADKWKGIRNASSYGSACLQADITKAKIYGDEDCLYLNVFVPKRLSNSGKLFPTMFWIHGGMFAFDSSGGFCPEYFMDEDIVLVTINYRLGPFGFFSTGDRVIRGNMGLKDQTMALKWVQANINHFSGDSKRVTIFGESAGGASVHHHVLSPMSKGLFRKAISQSGVAVAKWGTRTNPAEQAERFSKILGCPTDNSKSMADCLKSTQGERIAMISLGEIMPTIRDPLAVFIPSVEHIKDKHAFLTELPADILVKGNFNKVPWMSGVNSDEGLMTSASLYSRSLLKPVIKDFNNILPRLIWHEGKANPDQTQRIKEFYFRHNPICDTDKCFKNWTDIFTDSLFASPIHQAIRLQAEHSIVYPYYYSYEGEFTLTTYLLAISGKYPVVLEYLLYMIPRWFLKNIFRVEGVHYGACHFDEVALLFPLPGRSLIGPLDKDYEMSKAMVAAWVAFASEDSDSLQFNGVKWPAAVGSNKGQHLKYMVLDTSPKIIDEPNPGRNRFWETIRL